MEFRVFIIFDTFRVPGAAAYARPRGAGKLANQAISGS
jgi:hypothetical protein